MNTLVYHWSRFFIIFPLFVHVGSKVFVCIFSWVICLYLLQFIFCFSCICFCFVFFHIFILNFIM